MTRPLRTMSFNPMSKFLPGYQAIRFSEVIGEPCRSGPPTEVNVILKAAAGWFAEIDEARTLSIIGRTCNEEVIDQFFSRHRVAALAEEIVKSLTDSCKQCITRILDTKPVLRHNDESPLVQRTRRRLQATITILARLLVRFSPDKIPELWPIASAIHNSSYTYDNNFFPKELTELFDSLILASDDSTVESHLLELAEIPKWMIAANHNLFDLRFPNFLDTVKTRKPQLKPSSRDGVWKPVIDQLLHTMESGAPTIRDAAAFRLVSLWGFKLLTSAQIEHLRAIFWKSVSKSDGLPADWKFYSTIWLIFPPVNGEPIAERLRKWALPDLDTAQPPAINPDRLRCWLRGSITKNQAEKSPLVWSIADAKLMLSHIQFWWDKEGKSTQLRLPQKQSPLYWGIFNNDEIVQDVVACDRENRHPKNSQAKVVVGLRDYPRR
jgi:hypothetical protein